MKEIIKNLKGSVLSVKRTLVAVALAVVLVMALAAPAFAQINHSATYEMDGVIDLKKQAGHACNTGAAVKQTIVGSGVMDKVQTVSMKKGLISMDDDNNWVAGATALTVTTVWELCAPPKYTYDDGEVSDAVVGLGAMYANLDEPFTWGTGDVLDGTTVAMIADENNWDAVSDQIWAVQVAADPGFSGNLKQSGEAAYGPYEAGAAYDTDDEWDLKDASWGWDGVKAAVGPDYVGNYFTMDQHARTSQGTLKRYISVSSPFNHGYLMEDMSVTGKSDITETFAMANLPKGSDIVGLWWDLF